MGQSARLVLVYNLSEVLHIALHISGQVGLNSFLLFAWVFLLSAGAQPLCWHPLWNLSELADVACGSAPFLMIGPRANSSSCTQMTPKQMSPALTFLLSSRLRDPVACFSSSLGCLVASEADRVKPELLTSHSFFSCSCLTLPHLSKWVHCPPDCPGPKARGVAVSSLSSLHSPRALRPEACQPHPQGPTAAT